eukprot:CAMPEP_0119482514 /NCGR_PEP_ID=MMETSP1344-20130328/10332_1 /TAXON_ID=236787 /ORGANISM="Florenciella parvula, Strain CCMP2471" /LENGTH=320 /DNA_ID=CAMNT_0007516917 /DNA_START=1567 /DNA_END=2528 /DNA_ORIENTATION=-
MVRCGADRPTGHGVFAHVLLARRVWTWGSACGKAVATTTTTAGARAGASEVGISRWTEVPMASGSPTCMQLPMMALGLIIRPLNLLAAAKESKILWSSGAAFSPLAELPSFHNRSSDALRTSSAWRAALAVVFSQNHSCVSVTTTALTSTSPSWLAPPGTPIRLPPIASLGRGSGSVRGGRVGSLTKAEESGGGAANSSEWFPLPLASWCVAVRCVPLSSSQSLNWSDEGRLTNRPSVTVSNTPLNGRLPSRVSVAPRSWCPCDITIVKPPSPGWGTFPCVKLLDETQFPAPRENAALTRRQARESPMSAKPRLIVDRPG